MKFRILFALLLAADPLAVAQETRLVRETDPLTPEQEQAALIAMYLGMRKKEDLA